ncbi:MULTISPECIES: DUF4177 domain-containing protein [Spirosoma]|uniref:DUF4177 domain-containing protein n=1 Tax=Spirosoma sordidisoli TaxID=2502893 RepID=A0A4Q2UQL6_9BACT|nr:MULTISPECIES: DUF4177 domain-containing protein [Spirosoma]RYC71824.1 DUF4177 domain-containing protein [Spirosoma sordidisoli]
MKRFEYLTLEVDTSGFWNNKIDSQQLNDKLNELGREGWEVTSTVDLNRPQGATKGLLVILKREIG